MNRTNQSESKPESFWDTLLSGLMEYAVQGGCLLVLVLCTALPFMPTWLQVLVFLAPLITIALGIWWHGRRQKLKATSQAADAREEAPS